MGECCGPMPEKKKEGFDDWEINDMTRTIIEAEEIKQDPEKMKAIQGALDKKVKAVKSIDDLKSVKAERDDQE